MVNFASSHTSSTFHSTKSLAPVGGPGKRAADICLALTALVMLLPLLLLCALAAFVTTGGVLFRHKRVGLQGVTFDCLKFQTMVRDGERILNDYLRANPAARGEWELTRKLRDDPRVTPFGKVLRKTSVDELPQLINVLKGDMSIVGPRPIVEDELSRYGLHKKAYFQCRPGITGLWQISGRSRTTYRKRVACDAYYSRNWSLALDARIMARTVPVLFGSDDAF